MRIRRVPAAPLRSFATAYWGFEERTPGAMRRREGPGSEVVLIVSVEHDRLIDDERRTSLLGWSRKRLVARFRDHIGLPPKAVARLFRFERALALTGTASWTDIAFTCGFADQSHLISEFRAFTGRTPGTFLQDGVAAAA